MLAFRQVYLARPPTRLLASIVLWGLLASCAAPSPPASFTVTLQIVDEDGVARPDATVALSATETAAGDDGQARLRKLTGPDVALVSAPGHITEPVPLGWGQADTTVEVRLLRAEGRLVMHHGGDSMFGRRYEQPSAGEPLIAVGRIAQGARDIVSRLQRPFSVADYRSLNLETVVSTLGDEDAYPGKRFLLRAHPDTLEALQALQVDMVAFANNHSRDWMDRGVADTLTALEAAGIPQVGGGLDAAAAEAPLIQEVRGLRVGNLAYTTVTGSFVNDNYPVTGKSPPGDLADKEAWLYEARSFGLEVEGLVLPEGDYRIGDAWQAYKAAEGTLSDTASAEAWAQIVATFPEMQDWVARRGHGGAAMWRKANVAQIQALAARVDISVVQFHAGYQFQSAPSESVAEAARLAIDAGADIVIAHHPHVLQGMEWYRGRLIVYSLGNFIFDQDFLATFRSGFLRTIWEGKKLIQARFVPLEINGYRPTPVADEAAWQNLAMVWERSAVAARASRHAYTGGVHVFASPRDAETEAVHFVYEYNTARLTRGAPTRSVHLRVKAHQTVELDPYTLTPANLGLAAGSAPGVLVGRELFGWGRFEDELADAPATGGEAHWSLTHEDKQVQEGDAARGRAMLRLHRDDRNQSVLAARPVARVPLFDHRLYEDLGRDEAPRPLDPDAEFSIRMRARCSGKCDASVRLDIYDFDDTNPTEDPGSELLGREIISLDVPGSDWTTLEVPFDLKALTGSERANMIMFYVQLAPPPKPNTAFLDIDELQVIEWRASDAMPAIHGAYHLVRNSTRSPVDLRFDALVSTDVSQPAD